MDLCIPNDNPFVVVEEIHPKTGLPSAVNTVGPGLWQVVRRIFHFCDTSITLFKGRPMKQLPGFEHWIQELVLPGEQITTKRVGPVKMYLVYVGFTNILTPLPKIGNLLPETWTREYNLGVPPTPFTYGTDPLGGVRLYGRPSVILEMPGGKPPATAMALVPRGTQKLRPVPSATRKRILRQLLNR